MHARTLLIARPSGPGYRCMQRGDEQRRGGGGRKDRRSLARMMALARRTARVNRAALCARTAQAEQHAPCSRGGGGMEMEASGNTYRQLLGVHDWAARRTWWRWHACTHGRAIPCTSASLSAGCSPVFVCEHRISESSRASATCPAGQQERKMTSGIFAAMDSTTQRSIPSHVLHEERNMEHPYSARTKASHHI